MKNIYLSNLKLETEQLGLKIPWKKVDTKRDPLIYSKASIGGWLLQADMADKPNACSRYGFLLSLPLGEVEVVPDACEESELIVELGFFETQKLGLHRLIEVQDLLKTFHVTKDD